MRVADVRQRLLPLLLAATTSRAASAACSTSSSPATGSPERGDFLVAILRRVPDSETASGPVLVVSCSLNPSNRSHLLALAADSALDAIGAPRDLIDLCDWDLPICDGSTCYDHPAIGPLTAKVEAADAILIAAPVYNYDLNAAAKNLVELTGSAWAEKPVGFLCAAGGPRGYMSPIGLANSLMFDFRSHIIPRYVYATRDDFTPERQPTPELLARIDQLARAAVDLAAALRWMRARAE